MDDVQHIEQLPLVLVDALDLHVEQRVRIDDHSHVVFAITRRQPLLVGPLDRQELAPGMRASLGERLQRRGACRGR